LRADTWFEGAGVKAVKADRLVRVIAASMLCAAMAFVHAQMPATSRAERGEAFIPRPDVAKLAAFGFDALLADFYWLWAVQIVGRSDTDPSQRALELGRLIDVVTTLDPWVDHPYRFAAVWLIDSEESVRTGNRLLERGIQHHPREWRNRYHLGFNYFFYLQEHGKAAEVLEPAIYLPGSPTYLPRLVARLRSESADIDAAALFLSELIAETPDPNARSHYQGALDEIEVERSARALDRARKKYRARHGRDIEDVWDLVVDLPPIIPALPSPEPSSLPASLRRGARWEIDAESDLIVSSHYGRRYQVNVHPLDRQRNEEWQKRREEAARRESSGV
jgi:hypothetical protein